MTYYTKIALIAALVAAAMIANAVWTLEDSDARRPAPKIEMRLGWHAPDWRLWDKCETFVYVLAGPDGIVEGSESPGYKVCPDAFYTAKRRGLARRG